MLRACCVRLGRGELLRGCRIQFGRWGLKMVCLLLSLCTEHCSKEHTSLFLGSAFGRIMCNQRRVFCSGGLLGTDFNLSSAA